jgi:RNA methyltransferase, TrmH family
MDLGEPICSAQNAKLKAVRALRAGKERAATVLEGRHLLEEALAQKVSVSWILVPESVRRSLTAWGTATESVSADLWVLLERAAAAGVEIATCEDALLAGVSRLEGVPELLAWAMRPTGDWRAALQQSQAPDWWLVAAGVQDPGNLGALVRVAAGFGAAGMLCLKGGGSPWHPRALRGAAGTTFRLPVFEAIESTEFLAAAAQHDFELWATAADGEAVLASAATSRVRPVALLLGEEGRGLAQPLFDACQKRVGIPLERGVESLNVATAAAVLAAAMRGPQPEITP